MRKREIRVGGRYRVKVTGKVVVVRVRGENLHGGWDAVNEETGRPVRIRSAQRIREEVLL